MLPHAVQAPNALADSPHHPSPLKGYVTSGSPFQKWPFHSMYRILQAGVPPARDDEHQADIGGLVPGFDQ